MSKTPETDKEHARIIADHSIAVSNEIDRMADFARTLETQRDEARAEVERLRKRGQKIHRRAQKAERHACRVNRLFLKRKNNAEFWHREFFRHHGIGLTIATPNHRNTPPKIFKAHGLEWYRHTPGDKMPCDGEMRVRALCSKGSDEGTLPCRAITFGWDAKESDGIFWGVIIGWRPADAPEKLERKGGLA